MSGGQSGKALAENVAGANRVGAEELVETKDQNELATAERKVRKNAAVMAVNAIRESIADRARNDPGVGGERDDDPIGGEDQIRRQEGSPDESGEQIG